MHQILTHLVAVIDTSKDRHELVSKALAVSKLSYAQDRARELRSQHTDINHLVVIAEIVQFQRRSEDIYTTDPREVDTNKPDEALERIKGSGVCGGEHAGGLTYSGKITMGQTGVIGAFADPMFLKSHIEKLNPGRRLDTDGQALHTTRDDGWIEWNGGECPVGPGVIIDVVTEHREYYGTKAGDVPIRDWTHWGSIDKIRRYRVVKP
jgi:hypothetical protein